MKFWKKNSYYYNKERFYSIVTIYGKILKQYEVMEWVNSVILNFL